MNLSRVQRLSHPSGKRVSEPRVHSCLAVDRRTAALKRYTNPTAPVCARRELKHRHHSGYLPTSLSLVSSSAVPHMPRHRGRLTSRPLGDLALSPLDVRAPLPDPAAAFPHAPALLARFQSLSFACLAAAVRCFGVSLPGLPPAPAGAQDGERRAREPTSRGRGRGLHAAARLFKRPQEWRNSTHGISADTRDCYPRSGWYLEPCQRHVPQVCPIHTIT